MAKANPLIPAINAGEFSPKMRARTDFARYPAGAEVLRNFMIDERGGIFRRPGSYYAAAAKSNSARSYLHPMTPSSDDSYMLELADGVMRFYRDQGQISVVAHSSAIANGTFAANANSWTDVDGGSGVSAWSANNGGSLSLNGGGTANADVAGREQNVSIGAADQSKVHVLLFQVIGDYGPIAAQSDPKGPPGNGGEWATLRIGTSSGGEQLLADTNFGHGWHAVEFTPGAANVYIRFQHRWRNKQIYVDNISFHAAGALELTHPFTQAQIPDVRISGSTNFAYCVHREVHPYKLIRRGDRSWSMEKVGFVHGPFLDENTDPVLTLTFSAAALGFGMTCTATRKLFKTTDIGRLIRCRVGSGANDNYGYAIVVGYTSELVVTVDIMETITTSARFEFAMGAWCSELGFPSQVEMFKQRVYYASNDDQPTTIWGSQATDLENMRIDSQVSSSLRQVEDDDAIIYKILERSSNEIMALGVARDLIALSAGSETPITSSGPAITPLDVDATPDTNYGSNGVLPCAVNSIMVFTQRGGRRILRLGFDIRLEGYAAEDLTILSEHITRSGVTKMAHCQEPNSIIFCVLENGKMAALTFHPEQQVAGWSLIEIGGSYLGRHAEIEDVAVIPGSALQGFGDRDEVWLMVKRTINGSTARTIEILDRDFNLKDPIETCVYSDCALMVDYWNTDTTKTFTLSGPADRDDDDLWVAGTSMTLQATGHTPFTSGDVDEVWRLRYEGALLDVQITAYTDSDTVTVTVLQDVPDDFREAPIDEWRDPGQMTTAVSGLSHLEGEEVVALVDGSVQGPFTVSSGAITLDQAGACIVVGLQYEHRYKSLKIDAGAMLGTAIGKKKTVGDMMIDMYASAAVHVGPTFSKTFEDMTQTVTREGADPIGLPDKLWQGEYRISFKGPWGTDERLCIQGDVPLPCWILGLAPELETNEVL